MGEKQVLMGPNEIKRDIAKVLEGFDKDVFRKNLDHPGLFTFQKWIQPYHAAAERLEQMLLQDDPLDRDDTPTPVKRAAAPGHAASQVTD